MNKNNLQMIKRIVNLQINKNLLTKSNIHNYNKELEKKYNNNIIKKIDDNLNKLLSIENKRELNKQEINYNNNMIKKMDDNLNKLLSIEKRKQLEEQAYNNLSIKSSLIVFGASVIFTYYNCYLLLYS